jgi:hypothetical protein
LEFELRHATTILISQLLLFTTRSIYKKKQFSPVRLINFLAFIEFSASLTDWD